MLRCDKHKTSRSEGRSLTFLTDWLMTRAPRRYSWTMKSGGALLRGLWSAYFPVSAFTFRFVIFIFLI
ncbi:hypothetical protein D1970_19095 [Mesobacillus zeae]|uniref:Uncharacterized protein n=1 Tax=Mesobacillus zeae TaxID=1917180 RepID=A0A398B3I2_9BACI|nr:hypothetical protein D1970_19095 [Mesobacillus zeae]